MITGTQVQKIWTPAISRREQFMVLCVSWIVSQVAPAFLISTIAGNAVIRQSRMNGNPS